MLTGDDGRPSSPEDAIVDYQNLTVKFQISDTQIVAQVYPSCMTVAEVKTDLGKKFEVNSNFLVICQDGREVLDVTKVDELIRNEFGIAEVFLKIDDESAEKEKNLKLDLQVYYNKFQLADFITVNIPNKNIPGGPGKDIIVEIQNAAIEKPYLGGHRDTRTGKEYFDAYTQTGPTNIKYDGIASRDTQTAEIRSKAIDTYDEHATQAFGNATNLIYVASISDYCIESKPYETYEQKVKRENKIEKIILLQRNLRRVILWKYIRKTAAQYRCLLAEQKRRELLIIENKANKFKRDCVTKAFPKSKEDFDLLYAQVQRWKDAEIKRINNMYSGGPRIAKLNCLLDKEIQLLSGIEQQRSLVRKALKDFRDEQHLIKLGDPVKWIGYRDIVVEMDLLRTQRVRFLTELYKSMKSNMKKEDRLNLLSKLRDVLQKELDQKPGITSIAVELLDLLEREKNLLVCTKMGNCTLDTLRKRQIVLFIEIIKYEEEYVPEKQESKMCEKCKTVKPITNFALRTQQASVDVCKHCYYLRGTASDNSIYKAILRCVQRDERKRGTLASYAFIMQEDDVRLIVDKIWHGHSLLSKCNDLAELRLPRWIRSDDWSPWNCICLTEAEARAHDHLNALSDVYKDTMIQDIQSKHLLAKTTFKKLKDVDIDYVESGKWFDAGIEEKVV